MIEPLAKAKGSEQILRTLPGGLRLNSADQLRQDDILDRIELGQQVVELVDEPKQIAPETRSSLVVKLCGFLAVQSNGA